MYKETTFTENEIKKFVGLVPKIELVHGEEIFKQILVNGYHTQYLISNYGRVISTRYRDVDGWVRELKQKIRKNNGYCEIVITNKEINYKKSLFIHRLVALHFIKNPENKPEVNHIDGNKLNNHVSNLEWNTSKENIAHAYKMGLRKVRRGEEIADSKYREKSVIMACKMLEEAMLPLRAISDRTGISYDMIRHIRNHKSWKHISSQYNVDNHSMIYNDDNKEKIIKKACELLSTNKYSTRKICDMTGINYHTLLAIIHHKRYTNLSKDYNIDNHKLRICNK